LAAVLVVRFFEWRVVGSVVEVEEGVTLLHGAALLLRVLCQLKMIFFLQIMAQYKMREALLIY
jgi:hypothetical protein